MSRLQYRRHHQIFLCVLGVALALSGCGKSRPAPETEPSAVPRAEQSSSPTRINFGNGSGGEQPQRQGGQRAQSQGISIGDGPFINSFARLLTSQSVQPDPVPRYFANLACHTGDYTVSVRKVMGARILDDFFFNHVPSEPLGTVTGMYLTLQIMAKDNRVTERVSEFADKLEAIDDLGNHITTQEAFPIVTFPQKDGMARMVNLSAPKPGARYLRSLEGTFLLRSPTASSSKEQIIKFRIENIPLPVGMRLFGTFSCSYLIPAEASRLGQKAEQRQGVQIISRLPANFMLNSFMGDVPEVNPNTLAGRLVLQPDIENRFRLILPGKKGNPSPQSLNVRIRPHVGMDGEIIVDLTLQQSGKPDKSLSLPLKFWNGEPLLLSLPASLLPEDAPAGKSIALALCLYMEVPRGAIKPASPEPPFPAGSNERGSVLSAQMLVGDEPLQQAQVLVEIERKDTNLSQPTAQVKATLDYEGRLQWNNLSPGRYRVRLVEYTPRTSIFGLHNPLPEFLYHRYGVKKPTLANQEQNDLILRAGGRTELKPWRIVEAGTATTR